MKIVFKTLQSIDGVIQLSLDGGKNWTKYSILNIKEDGGIPIPEDQDLSLIKIKSDSTTLNNLEVISSINAETVMNMTHVDDLIVDKSLKLDKKDAIEEISVLDITGAPQFTLQDKLIIIHSRQVLNLDVDNVEEPEAVIGLQNIFNNMPTGMCSYGYIITDSYEDVSLADPLTGYSLDNFKNISYEYHSYDEYLEYLNALADPDTELLPFYGLDTINEGETKAVQGALIEETDYIVNASKQNGNITLSLTPGDFSTIIDDEEKRIRLVFLKKVTVQKVNTEYSAINLNGTTLDFASCKEWKELSLDNVNKFIHKYDSENNILYSLIATTNNENVPDELEYSMIVYLNHDGGDGDFPNDVWYSTNDDKSTDIYSFNFEFNNNINDYEHYIQLVDTPESGIWSEPDDEGNRFFYALTSADKKGFRFIKDSSGTIKSEQFDLSTIKEYTPVVSFIKKDRYSLYRKESIKKPQIKIEGQLPKEDGVIFVNDKGEPSFITIEELRNLMFPGQ